MPTIFGNNIPTVGIILNETFPIQQKGKANRLTLPGVPTIESEYHKAMEMGRKLESSIGDAMFQIQAKKLDIQEKITTYMDINVLAIDGQFRHGTRKFKFAADSIHFLQVVHKYTQEVANLITALQTNIGILQQMERNILAMIQTNINALSNLLGEICNWGIPNLASIPNLFNGAGASIWQWNGFNFFPLNPLQIGNMLLAGFVPPGISIPTFGFDQCKLLAYNLGIFGNQPAQVNQGVNVVGTALFVPPLSGVVGDPTQFSNPTYITAQQADKTVPVYNPETFNPYTSMIGSLPDPTTIISAYQLPPATYAANAISLNPNLVALVTPAGGITTAAQTAALRQNLIRFVNLDQVVASNYDPNLTALWILYLSLARSGRGGQWLIANMQVAYDQYIRPSVVALEANPVPYNNVLDGPGVVNSPNVPLISTLSGLDSATQQNVLWKLSYLEAGLLGYSRSGNYDSGADTTFLSTFTGSSVDYISTTFDATDTQPVTLGADTAQFPTVANVPKALINTFNAVVALASTNIAGAPNYQTNLTRFKFVYDPFAVAVEVDRYTQFWRTFNYNFQQLLLGDSYVVNQVVSYVQALDSAVDPLADSTIFTQILSDANSRNRNWTPGTPLPPIPTAPNVLFTAPSGLPLNTGWNGTNFSPADFLARPDIQALPIPVQTAMLRTNLSYSVLLGVQSDVQNTVNGLINSANSSIADFNNAGWHVLANAPQPIAVNGSFPVSFADIDYDITGNVTSPNLITIQTAGTYALSGQVQWDTGGPGTRTVNLILNGTTVLASESTSNIATGPITQTFSAIQPLNVGDTLQVLVTNGTTTTTNLTMSITEFYGSIVPNPYVSPPFTDAEAEGGNPDSATRQIQTEVNLVAGQAVRIDSNGFVTPIDPEASPSPPNIPYVDGVATGPAVAGTLANIATNYGSEYTIAGASFTTGGLVYAGPLGILTQNYATLVSQVNWIVVVGKATAPGVLLLQPQLPQRSVDLY